MRPNRLSNDRTCSMTTNPTQKSRFWKPGTKQKRQIKKVSNLVTREVKLRKELEGTDESLNCRLSWRRTSERSSRRLIPDKSDRSQKIEMGHSGLQIDSGEHCGLCTPLSRSCCKAPKTTTSYVVMVVDEKTHWHRRAITR